MSLEWGARLHLSRGGNLNASAYWSYVGQWSRLFVPALLDAAGVAPGQSVLDVATGSGEAADLASSAVGKSGMVVGVDVSPAMLEAARDRLSGSTFRAVAMDAASIAFRDLSFDAVICQLGLMFFPQRLQSLMEMRRVLRRGSRASVCVPCSAECAPMCGVLAETLVRFLPERTSALLLTFSLSDPAKLEMLFREAGFHDVEVRREARTGAISSFDEYWRPIESGTGQLPQAYVALPDASRREVREEVHQRLAKFEIDGRLDMRIEMLIATGRA